MFTGYLEWSGTELVNIERTEAYVARLAPALLTRQGTKGGVHRAVGDAPYVDPLTDGAPWANSFDPATKDFYGLYPLGVTGIGNSTYAAGTTESVGTGGTTQGGRSATRDVKVSGLLVASTELGAEAGLTWLRNALQTAGCDDQCGGYLRYFLAEPDVPPTVAAPTGYGVGGYGQGPYGGRAGNTDASGYLMAIDRSLHNVAVTQGPQIIQRIDDTARCIGYMIQVEFLLVAGNPYSYGPPVDVATTPLLAADFADPAVIEEPVDDWLFDPSSMLPSPPPSAPSIPADAINPNITAWRRYYVTVPARDVADWASSVPLLTISTLDLPVRQVRVRFHPNPFEYLPTEVDPAAFCADFLVSYLPARSSLLMNGITQTALASKAGVASVPADSVLYGSDGGPMVWPRLSCGISYVMTIDVPGPNDFTLFDVGLQLTREE